jgi:roadblock/LC7 domain-containing protein
MADLDRLMELRGAEAAFAINDRGELQQHRLAEGSQLTEQVLDLLAHMCVANTAIATMQARGWEARAETRGFYPVGGFTLIGMHWSAITDGHLGVVVYNKAVDYEAAYRLLAEQRGGS